jgi:hypothetical protein
VITCRPNADTARQDWSPHAGRDNHARVNETLIEGDDGYVESELPGDRDL